MTHPLAALIAGAIDAYAEKIFDAPIYHYDSEATGKPEAILFSDFGLSVDVDDAQALGVYLVRGNRWHGLSDIRRDEIRDTEIAVMRKAFAPLRDSILAALEAAPVPDMTDSVTVHANMLRGTIAKPTVDQIIHLYGREAFQPMIDAAVAKALKDACLAVSEHADWPEDEHGRTEQAGLFARVINAICAIAPAAPHVNETPKSEHDAGNVLTVPDLVEAGKVRPPFFFDRYINGVRMAEGVCVERESTLEGAIHVAARIAAKGPNGEPPVLIYRSTETAALIAHATAQQAQIAGLEAEKVLEGVTPGPWRVGPVDDTRVEDADGNEVAQIDGDYNQPETWPLMEANARFIAWCREGVPALIALATAQAAQIAGLEKERDRYLRHLTAGAESLNAHNARAEAAEAKVAELEAQIAGQDVTSRPNAPAHIVEYTNYRGETARRTIIPIRFWWGSTEWHPEEQWMLSAWDVEKDARRDFAWQDMRPVQNPATSSAIATLRDEVERLRGALEAIYEITVEPAETDHKNVRGWIEVSARAALEGKA